MSSLWHPELAAASARRPVWARADAEQPFVPWSAELIESVASPCGVPIAEEVIDLATLKSEAFAEGYDEGQRVLCEAIAAERQALAELAASLEAMKPQSTPALGHMLAETVDRLVRQIVGEVAVDAATLQTRCLAAIRLIGDETAPCRLRLNPADAERLAAAALPVPIVADKNVAPGTVLLETAQGWIEDGPEARLEQLRAALDQIELA